MIEEILKDDTWLLYRNPKQRRYPLALEASSVQLTDRSLNGKAKDPIAIAFSSTSRFLLEFVFSSAGAKKHLLN